MNDKKFTTKISIAATSALVASRKKSALEMLSANFSARELQALADKGPAFINHADYGPMIRKELGL